MKTTGCRYMLVSCDWYLTC